jgi:hypothetical protein
VVRRQEQEVIRLIRQAARWRRFFCWSLAAPNSRSPVGLNLLLMPGEHDRSKMNSFPNPFSQHSRLLKLRELAARFLEDC